MTSKAFDEFVKNANTSRIPDKDWAGKELAQWRHYLSIFYAQVESYLKSYVNDGQIALEEGEKEFNEESIGIYTARMLTIHVGGERVKLTPIGTNLIGAKGRIDMEGTRGKVRFVLVEAQSYGTGMTAAITTDGRPPVAAVHERRDTIWKWKIATSQPHLKYLELNEDTFYGALMEVARG